MSPITTHVLDTAAGRPAAGISAVLDILGSDGVTWNLLGQSVTDADGRIRSFLADGRALLPGLYRIRFDTSHQSRFFPEVTIEFRVDDPAQHYHVPLLLSPYGYSTYRGS
ncbi:MAG: hydroxyisourate hydrolase [Acidobacteriota bacterium]|nr:hydroxyisourate hydrolase [Acidobacteriota bacterium]